MGISRISLDKASMSASSKRSAQQFALDVDDNLKNEVKKSGFVTSAGYQAMLQQMVVNKEMSNESIHKDVCHDVHDGGGSRRRRRRPTGNRLGSMISSGSSILSASIRFGSTRSSTTASSTLSTRTSLTDSEISRRSWPQNHNLDTSIISFDDKLDISAYISGDINIASTDNLAPRKLSGTETSLTQSVNTIQQEMKKYKPRSTRRRPFNKKLSSVDFDPKEVDNVTQDDKRDVNVRQPLQTEVTGDEKEVDEFDPQAFLDGLLKKQTQPSSCANTKESEEWLPWPTSKSTSSSNEDDDGSSISLSSSSSRSLDKDDIKDDCWLSWPKIGDTASSSGPKPSKSSTKKAHNRKVIRSARAA